MYFRSTTWVVCMFVAAIVSTGHSDADFITESPTTQSVQEGKETTTVGLEPKAETSTPPPATAGSSVTTPTATPTAAPAPATQPHSDLNRTSASAPPPVAVCSGRPLNTTAVSNLRKLSSRELANSLTRAALRGKVEELRELLAAGGDLRLMGEDADNWTALHWTMIGGHVKAASCLLAAGAEVDARDNKQNTPLHMAAYWGHADMARLLLAASADPNARNEDGRTPLHNAGLFGNAEVASALLQAGANRGATDNEGKTPLYLATLFYQKQLIEILS